MRVLLHFGDNSTSYLVTPAKAAEILIGKLRTKCEFSSSSPSPDVDELARLLEECEVVVGSSITLDATICSLFKSAPKLRLVQCIGAGIDKIPLDSIRGTNIKLADASGSNSVPVAEHALALILVIAKKIVERDREVKAGIWERTPAMELQGKTHVILGLGAIGTELARRSQAFGMRVIGIKKHPTKGLETRGVEVHRVADLHNVLPMADFLTISLPLTNETKGLIGKDELTLLKDNASIVIVSRAAIVDEKALHEFLVDRRDSHAGIDTWYSMPPNPSAPSAYSIQKLDNVVATPHIAGITPETVDRVFSIVSRNIDALESGKVLENLVDLDLGY